MKSSNTHMFIRRHESGGFTKRMREFFSKKPDAKWVIVTRSEYRRLQVMQGVLLLISLFMTGIMIG